MTTKTSAELYADLREAAMLHGNVAGNYHELNTSWTLAQTHLNEWVNVAVERHPLLTRALMLYGLQYLHALATELKEQRTATVQQGEQPCPNPQP